MSKGRKIIIGVIVALLLIVLGIYFVGAYYFTGHFQVGTRINGIDCSMKTVEQVQGEIADKIATYSLTLGELDGVEETITAQDIGLEYVEDNSVAMLLAGQNRWTWLMGFTGSNDFTTTAATTYDESRLTETVKNLNCFKNMTQPEDAHIDEKDGVYYVVPEVVGNALDETKVVEIVKAAVEAGDRQVSLVDTECYLKPSVLDDDAALAKEVEELNKYTTVTIHYDFGDREETVDGDLIRTWLVKGEDGSYTLDDAALADYVYQLAYKYDTFGMARQFTTATGQTITTAKGGDYGYVIKQDETVEQLKAAIMSGESQTLEPVYLYSGVCRDTNDIGLTYVEIDLSNQMMYFYKDGSLLVETPVVTGQPSKGNGTPTGVYAIDAKKSPAVLKGEDYASDVTYWLPFNNNVGIHDCGTWRTEFGGDIYLTNGSHGCVNTPYDAAQTIYNNVEIGMPVIVY